MRHCRFSKVEWLLRVLLSIGEVSIEVPLDLLWDLLPILPDDWRLEDEGGVLMGALRGLAGRLSHLLPHLFVSGHHDVTVVIPE